MRNKKKLKILLGISGIICILSVLVFTGNVSKIYIFSTALAEGDAGGDAGGGASGDGGSGGDGGADSAADAGGSAEANAAADAGGTAEADAGGDSEGDIGGDTAADAAADSDDDGGEAAEEPAVALGPESPNFPETPAIPTGPTPPQISVFFPQPVSIVCKDQNAINLGGQLPCLFRFPPIQSGRVAPASVMLEEIPVTGISGGVILPFIGIGGLSAGISYIIERYLIRIRLAAARTKLGLSRYKKLTLENGGFDLESILDMLIQEIRKRA